MTRTRLILLGLVALVIATVCIRLGLWQLDRLKQRRAENARIAAGIAGTPVGMGAIGDDSTQSRALRVRVEGRYDFDNEVVLINRSRDGSPGVHLLTPLRVDGKDTAVLVNRGWVYSPDGSTVDAALWREPAIAVGTAYVSWLLRLGSTASAGGVGGVDAPAGDAPTIRRVPRADRDALSRLVPYPIAPYQLILLESTAMSDGGEAYGGSAAPPLGTGAAIDRTRPVRIPLPALDEGAHQSYAIQWFAFAAIALVGTAAVARAEWSRGGADTAL